MAAWPNRGRRSQRHWGSGRCLHSPIHKQQRCGYGVRSYHGRTGGGFHGGKGKAPWVDVLLGSFIDWSALLLYILPTRLLFGRMIGASDRRQVGLGLFLGTWCIAGLVHLSTGAIIYYLINWPGEVWLAISPLAPVEHVVRCVVGSTIGLGVISGLRAINIQRPPHALY